MVSELCHISVRDLYLVATIGRFWLAKNSMSRACM